METALIVSLIELIIKHGPTVAVKIIKTFKSDTPTPEEIRALLVKSPEEYFAEIESG